MSSTNNTPISVETSKRYMWIGIGAAIAAVLALIATVVVIVVNRDSEPSVRQTSIPVITNESESPSTPEAVDLDGAPSGGIIFNPSGKPEGEIVTVSVFSDFMCSWCFKFETEYGDKLKEMANEGKIALDFHPLPFLSDGTNYSSRTSIATFAVGTLENDKLPAFNKVLFENFPDAKAPLSDTEIADVARQVGVSEETIAAFQAAEYQTMSETAKSQALNDAVKATPSVMFDGSRYSLTRDDFAPVGASIFLATLDAKVAAKG